MAAGQARGLELGGDSVVGWQHIHTHGQYVLVPYGDGSDPPDVDELVRMTE